MGKARREEGFTYLALLFCVAVLGAVLAVTGIVWSTAQQREKERDLLFVGNEFRKAIASYYEKSPGTVKRYPNNFNDLLKDNRMLSTVRHLRRVYTDPMTQKAEWGIVRAPDGGIMGIYSFSTATPIKQANFPSPELEFEKAKSYADWRFIYQPTNMQSLKVRGSQHKI